MSAIVGILHRDGKPVEPNLLRAMADTLRHRGPDWEHSWLEGAVGLGNRMLWTTKSSCLEQMPSWDAGHDTIITADCRLDNREDLWRMLGRQGIPGEEVTDSALILLAYARWGEKCPRYLLGDFAFAIWDRPQRKLFCARDPLGVKPFYYHCSDHLFLFASEIKGILKDVRIDRELDEAWIGDYLIDRWTDKTHTIYRSIRRLEPAHTLQLDERDVRMERYWALDPEREVRYKADEEYFEEFRSLFYEAVRCRMKSVYPVGSMLSGGLDSSSITCVARALSNSDGSLHSFSAVFPSIPQCDESAYIQTVLAQDGLQSHCLDASVVGTLHEYKRKLWHLDQPLTGYNSHMGWFLLDHARAKGIRVVLDGTDGDSTVSYGTGYYRDLARAGQWGTLLSEARALRRMHGSPVWVPFMQGIWRFGLSPRIPEGIKQIRRAIRLPFLRNASSRPMEDPFWNWLDSEFIRRNSLREKREKAEVENRSQTSQEGHWKQMNSSRIPLLLELQDHRAAAFGIEQRLPFCDRRLVEYCLAIPTGLKSHQGFDRYIMRQALRDVLPQGIAERPGKADLTDVFLMGAKKHDVAIWENHLTGSLEAISDYIDLSFVKEKCIGWREGSLDRMEMRVFWHLMVLGLWMRERDLQPDL
jgi:asparagine synthase (glutamine-hydrolysing)